MWLVFVGADGGLDKWFSEDIFYSGLCWVTPLDFSIVKLKPYVGSAEVSLWIIWSVKSSTAQEKLEVYYNF